MLNKLYAIISNINLRPKLMLAFLITVSLPVLLAAIFSLTYFSGIALRNAKANLLDKRQVAVLLSEKKGKELQSIGQTIATNNLVLLDLELLLYPPVTDYLRTLRKNINIDFISILDPQGKVIISSNREYFIRPESPVLDTMMIENIKSHGPQSFFLDINSSEFLHIEGLAAEQAFCFVNIYPIYSYEKKLLGFVFFGSSLQGSVDKEQTAGLLDEINKNVGTPVLVLIHNTPVAFSEGPIDQFNFQLWDEGTAQKITQGDDVFINIGINNKLFFFSFFSMPYNGNDSAFLGVGFLEAQFYEARNTAAALLALITCIGFALAAAIAFVLSKKISEPVILMAEGAKQLVDGNFEKRIAVTSGDEIGLLAKEFNFMTERLKATMESLKAEIAERKETELKLEKARNYLKNVFNSLTSLLVSVDPDGCITAWNTAAERQTGIPASQVLSKKVWEILPFLRRYEAIFDEVVKSRNPRQFNRELIEGNESQFLNISIFPLVSNGSDGAVFLVDDVSEIERKDLQLRQAQKMEMIGSLVGGLAHDFNNVLGAILGSASLIKHHLRHEEFSIDYVDEEMSVIEESTKRAADMVNELLILSRKQEIFFTPLDLNQVIRNVVKICHSSFDKSIEISANLPPVSPMIRADLTQIEQVLLNLCVNASHAMTIMKKSAEKNGGDLIINLEKIQTENIFQETHPEAKECEYWVISVSDTGVGMDTKTIAKVFDPFFTTKDRDKGTGLGLSIVYNIVHQHGGFIDVYSEAGIGSTFKVYLPVFKGELEMTDKNDGEIPRGEGVILVIDDEKFIREQSKKILEKCGYSVILADGPEQGIEIFGKMSGEINVVLLDLAMPKMSGHDVYFELKKINPNPKIVIMSGFSNDSRIQDLVREGAASVLHKPFSLKDLSEKIKEVFEGTRQN